MAHLSTPATSDPTTAIGSTGSNATCPLDSCPACASRDFLIQDFLEVVFRCIGCGTGWRCHLGYVWAVDT